MTMFDRHISGNLAAHIDGQLTARASEQAEIHLARCPRCRSDLEDVRIGMAMLEHLPVAAAPEGLWTSIEGALGGVERGRLLPAGLWRFAAVAALAAVAAAGVYWQYARRSAT
ncbi:MAG: zf-HC2 domain-containing protein, partial [Bryobacteraceae bacterium]